LSRSAVVAAPDADAWPDGESNRGIGLRRWGMSLLGVDGQGSEVAEDVDEEGGRRRIDDGVVGGEVAGPRVPVARADDLDGPAGRQAGVLGELFGVGAEGRPAAAVAVLEVGRLGRSASPSATYEPLSTHAQSAGHCTGPASV